MLRLLPLPLRVAALALCVAGLLVAKASLAGCGCDHPPPDWTPVMPPFASPGKTIVIHADETPFTIGRRYSVTFDGFHKVTATATDEKILELALPSGLRPGPTEIHVTGRRFDLLWSDELFTALPPAAVIPKAPANYFKLLWELAVTRDGELLIPIDVSDILDPTQFAFVIHDLPLAFTSEDVVIYNADGVDLTLFTMEVEDSTHREWGEYYGWKVEGDDGLSDLVYDNSVIESRRLGHKSDTLTYWRHEFFTYAKAHARGGTHEVNRDGYHIESGTLHIDHDHLIIAIRGLVLDSEDPLDADAATPLTPGHHALSVSTTNLLNESPLDLDTIHAAAARLPNQVLLDGEASEVGDLLYGFSSSLSDLGTLVTVAADD